MNFVYNKYEGNSSDTERYRQTDSRIVDGHTEYD